MANYSQNNYESPETGVDLDWGKVPQGWHPRVKALYLSMKDNPWSKFFYQSDVEFMRLLAEEHSDALRNPDIKAADRRVLYDQWKLFGVTTGHRANQRYTMKKTATLDNYDDMVTEVVGTMWKAEEED